MKKLTSIKFGKPRGGVVSIRFNYDEKKPAKKPAKKGGRK